MTSAIADLQQSIKIKSSDLREELKDLEQWENEIKRRNLHAVKVTPELAPVRGTNTSTPTPVATRSKAAQAETAKEQGNEYFRRGEYKEAIRLYTKGIDVDPSGPIAHIMYANRAMCHLKADNWADAESDASHCIELKRTYHKAYYRRALARRGLKKLVDARKDLETVLALVPNDAETTKELTAVTLLMRQEDKAKTKATAPTRRKMVIEEVDEDDDDDDDDDEKKIIEQKEQKESVKTKDPVTVDEKKEPTNPSGNIAKEHQKSAKASVSKPVKCNPRVEELSDDDTIETNTIVSEAKKSASSVAGSAAVSTASVSKVTPASSVSHGKTAPTVVVITKENLKMPRTFSEFERYHADLRNNNELFDYYLSLISPRDFSSLFGTAMTPEMLTSICQSVTRNTPSVAYATLSGLADVKRMDDLIMFLSDDEAKSIEAAIDHAKITNNNMEYIISKFM